MVDYQGNPNIITICYNLNRTEAFTAISIRIKDGMNETEAELSRRKQVCS